MIVLRSNKLAEMLKLNLMVTCAKFGDFFHGRVLSLAMAMKDMERGGVGWCLEWEGLIRDSWLKAWNSTTICRGTTLQAGQDH